MNPLSDKAITEKADKVIFPYKGGSHSILTADIIRLRAESNYTYIYVRDQKPILMAKVLSAYEALLEPFGFIRTHRSHLINTQHVESVSTSGEVIMDDQSTAEVSRRRRRQIMYLINHHGDAA